MATGYVGPRVNPQDAIRGGAGVVGQAAIAQRRNATLSGNGGGIETLRALKAKAPGAKDMTDAQFALAAHEHYYSDVPLVDFLAKMGLDRGDVLYETRQPGDQYGAYVRSALATPGGNEIPDQAAKRMGGSLPDRRPGTAEGMLRGFLQGSTLGFGDEMVAGGAAALDPLIHGDTGKSFGQRFDTYLSREQGNRDKFREDNPAAAWGSEIGGALSTAMLTPLPASNFGRLAIEGAEGAIYGFGGTDGDARQRAYGAGAGGALGLGGGALGGMIGEGLGALGRGMAQRSAINQAVKAAPAAAAHKAASKAGYAAVEATGAVVSPQAMKSMVTRAVGVARQEGILLPTGRLSSAYPKVNDALHAIAAYGAAPMDMAQAQVVAKTIRRAAGAPGSEGTIGKKLLSEYESFMDALPMSAFSRGDGKSAVRLWTNARKDWARYRRTATIEDAANNARFHKNGFAAGIKAEFGKIVRSPKKMLGFSDDEKKAMEAVAEGAPLDDFLRFLQRGGAFPAYVTGHLAGGGIGGAALATAKVGGNLGLRMIANRAARKTAQEIRAQVATPGGLPIPPPVPVGGTLARRIGVGAALPATDIPRQALVGLLDGRR